MHPSRFLRVITRARPGLRCGVMCAAAIALAPSPLGAREHDRFKKEWFGVSDREKMGLVSEARSGPFVCYAESPGTAERALEVAEATCARAAKALGTRQQIRKTIVLCVWDGRNAYQTHASLYYLSARSALAFASRSVIPGADAVFGYVRNRFFAETLPHEIAHIALYNLLDPSGGTTPPTWLHEGFAQLMEDDRDRVLRKARFAVLKAEEDEETIHLWQLTTPKAPKDIPGVYYAEALLLADFLMRNQESDDAFGRLCVFAARNPRKEFEHYFRNYYPQFKDLRECDARWLASVREDLKVEADRALAAASGGLAEARGCEARGDRSGAMERYRRAFSALYILLTGYSHAEEKYFDAQKALGVLLPVVSRAQALCDRTTSSPLLPGDARGKAEEVCGEPQGGRYRDEEKGVEAAVDSSGTVTEVLLTRPGAGQAGGIRVGDTIEELALRWGIFAPHAQGSLRALFLSAAETVPGAGMDTLRDGTYPVVSPGGEWIGSCVRGAIDREMDEWEDGNWFFLRAAAAPDALVLFSFENDKVSEIALRRRADARTVAAARVREGAAGIVPRDPKTALCIGDSEEKIIRTLGEPDEREPYLIPEISASDTVSRGRYRLKKKVTKRTGLFKIEYPGLDMITWDGVVISITAGRPSLASVHGLRIGDPLSTVTRVMGSSKAVLKHEKKQQADELDDRENYRGLFVRYSLGTDRAGAFKMDAQRKIQRIFAYATEWRGTAWGDEFMIK